MARRYELIVFDWDGTLLDSAAAIAASIQAAARDLGLAPPSDQQARHIIGLGLDDALRHALPDLPRARYGELSARYRQHYLAQDQALTLFAGAEELIRALGARGHMLAVATGKSRHGLERAFETSGLGSLFHGSRCADECHSKPHPQMLEELIDEFGTTAETTLMIGDTSHDMLMAHNAGVSAVAVSYGAHDRQALLSLEPLHCVDSMGELSAWLSANA
ncbi:MAG: HAD-IA family hydrolase [Rhodocyclaceae bacterium]|nr:HAD-IA family hydrolase [Rhodocyclaceae bacterium]